MVSCGGSFLDSRGGLVFYHGQWNRPGVAAREIEAWRCCQPGSEQRRGTDPVDGTGRKPAPSTELHNQGGQQ
jgi:hypothetical protein